MSSYQWNTSKLNQLGYEDAYFLLLGFANATTFVGWGAQYNLTFQQLFKKVQNFNLSTPEIILLKNNWVEERIFTEIRFYPKYGICYELVNLTISKNTFLLTNLNTLEGKNVPAQVIITDKKLRTRHTLHRETHWGSRIVVEQGMEYFYMIKVEQISNFDPYNSDECKKYDVDEFDKCYIEELHRIWKPLINCNPPWVSFNDHCTGDLNVKRKTAELVFNNSIMPVAEIYEMVSYKDNEICIKSCTLTQTMILLSEKHENKYAKAHNQSYLRLNFASEVIYTTKKLAYGSSEFLIDMGSSLGLWFGLSVFGITDLGIMALQWVSKLRRRVKEKYFK